MSVPLSSKSAHHPHVHATWPRARFRVLQKLASSDSARHEAQLRFISKFIGHFIPPPSITPVVRRIRDGKEKSSPKSLWLPLSFHPSWYRILNRALARLACDNSFCNLYTDWSAEKSMPTFRIAWKNAGPSIEFELRRHTTRSVMDLRTEEGAGQEANFAFASSSPIVEIKREQAVCGSTRTRRSKFKF